jgi:hypothetical protein
MKRLGRHSMLAAESVQLRNLRILRCALKAHTDNPQRRPAVRSSESQRQLAWARPVHLPMAPAVTPLTGVPSGTRISTATANQDGNSNGNGGGNAPASSGPAMAATAGGGKGNGNGGNAWGANGNSKGNGNGHGNRNGNGNGNGNGHGNSHGNGHGNGRRSGQKLTGGNKWQYCCVERQRLIRIAPWR